MNSLCIETGYRSFNKHGEVLCGDCIDIVVKENNSKVVVLADGLGSGVKANILSTLTAKIISTMMAEVLTIEDCVSTMAATLPVCSQRGVAYSTFSIISLIEGDKVELIQYENPRVVLLRQGKSIDYQANCIEIDGKKIYKSQFPIFEGDIFIAFSDGAIHAGPGTNLNFDWDLKDIILFMESIAEVGYSAKTLATILAEQCNRLYGDKPGDDISVCVIKIRKREPVNLLIGPPLNPEDCPKMMSLFFAKEGKHIVCGGTTSSIAADYLSKPLCTRATDEGIEDSDIPPTSTIEGVDLVTEGAVTISRVLEYSQDYLGDNKTYEKWCVQRDGASKIARKLFEDATDINIFVGRALNPAYQSSIFSSDFNVKVRMVEDLSENLKKMGKTIKVSYF